MVLDIFAPPFARAEAGCLSMLGEGPRRPEAATSMAHVWNDKYEALYDRTYRVLYDAGINSAVAIIFAIPGGLPKFTDDLVITKSSVAPIKTTTQ